MRHIMLAAALALGLVGVAACDDQDAAKTAAEAGQTSPVAAAPIGARPRVALVVKTLATPFFVAMEQGARRAEADLGIELVVKAAAQETSTEQQIAIVDALLRDKVGAIVIAPGDAVKLVPVLKKAQDAGVALVVVDTPLDSDASAKAGLGAVPFVGVDAEKGGYLSAAFIAQDVAAPTQAVVIEGAGAGAAARKAGALRAFAENPNIQVVAQETANGKIDEAYDVAQAIFARAPDVKLVFCANDMMALGAARYLQDTQRTGVKIAGYDALDEARQALRRGALAVTVDQQAAQQGFVGVHMAVRALRGEALPAETLVDVRLVSEATPDP